MVELPECGQLAGWLFRRLLFFFFIRSQGMLKLASRENHSLTSAPSLLLMQQR